jgi:hypothetical protein
MRKLLALVFNHSLNGLLADEGTDFWTFCFDELDKGSSICSTAGTANPGHRTSGGDATGCVRADRAAAAGATSPRAAGSWVRSRSCLDPGKPGPGLDAVWSSGLVSVEGLHWQHCRRPISDRKNTLSARLGGPAGAVHLGIVERADLTGRSGYADGAHARNDSHHGRQCRRISGCLQGFRRSARSPCRGSFRRR